MAQLIKDPQSSRGSKVARSGAPAFPPVSRPFTLARHPADCPWQRRSAGSDPWDDLTAVEPLPASGDRWCCAAMPMETATYCARVGYYCGSGRALAGQ